MTNKQKQNLLQYLGYYSGNIDGAIGPQTRAAVLAYVKTLPIHYAYQIRGSDYVHMDVA